MYRALLCKLPFGQARRLESQIRQTDTFLTVLTVSVCREVVLMYLDQVFDHLACFLPWFRRVGTSLYSRTSGKVIGAKFIFDHSLAILEVCLLCCSWNVWKVHFHIEIPINEQIDPEPVWSKLYDSEDLCMHSLNIIFFESWKMFSKTLRTWLRCKVHLRILRGPQKFVKRSHFFSLLSSVK